MIFEEDSELLDSSPGSSKIWTSPFLISSSEMLEDSALRFLDFFFRDKIFFLYFFSVQRFTSEAY